MLLPNIGILTTARRAASRRPQRRSDTGTGPGQGGIGHPELEESLAPVQR